MGATGAATTDKARVGSWKPLLVVLGTLLNTRQRNWESFMGDGPTGMGYRRWAVSSEALTPQCGGLARVGLRGACTWRSRGQRAKRIPSHWWRAGAQVGATARPVAAISEKSTRLELDS